MLILLPPLQVLRQTKQSDSGSWFSYGASMAANVLENIQVNAFISRVSCCADTKYETPHINAFIYQLYSSFILIWKIRAG